MSSRSFAVDPAIDAYIESLIPSETPLQSRLRELTQAMPEARMQIGPAQGQFMAMLAKLVNVKRYLEIGVFTGYSSLVMAAAMPEDGRVVACDVSEEYTSIAREYWKEAGVEHKIDLRLAPALETLDGLIAGGQGGSFDIAFIDADKENIPAYFERCLRLVRKNGLIMIDNVLWSGRILEENPESNDTRVLKEFNQRVFDDGRVEALMLPIADGLTMARVR